jgi:signal transduction histidine kinase
VLDTAPDKSRDALLTVEETGRTAMAELRNLLGVLGNDGLDPALAPQPGMADLDGLIDRVREAGLPVELRIEGQPRGLPPGVDLAAFRIVQEALTNALKYSGLAHTDVILDYRDRELKLEVLDEGTAGQRAKDGPEPGRGLVGMRERVALFGGMLEAGPRLSGGYAVRAWLPLPGAES